jgi:hypothetical protein
MCDINTKPNINLLEKRKIAEIEYCICKNNNNRQCKKKLQISLVVSLNLLAYHFWLLVFCKQHVPSIPVHNSQEKRRSGKI